MVVTGIMVVMACTLTGGGALGATRITGATRIIIVSIILLTACMATGVVSIKSTKAIHPSLGSFFRAGESEGAVMNLMIECSCDRIVRSREELLEAIIDLLESRSG